MLKNRNDPKLSEANFHARLCHCKHLLKNIHNITFVHWRKDIYSDYTEKPAERASVRNMHVHQPKRNTSWLDKTNAHTIVLAFSHWWHQLASNKWLTQNQFDTYGSRSQGYRGVLIATWCCYNSFCSPTHRISSDFIFQQDGAPAHRALEAINFPHNFVKTFFQKKLSSKYVVKSHHIQITLLHYTLWYIVNQNMYFWLWLPCVADANIVFLPCGFFFLSFFFPRLISVVAEWMFAILAHMVWP